MQRRDVQIELGGMKFRLKYEAENLFALSKIAGEPWLKYVRRSAPQPGETQEDVGMRCSDLAYTLPLIMAGLAHLDEFSGLSQRDLERRVCRLVDAEVAKRGVTMPEVLGQAFADIMPVLVASILPPGVEVDADGDGADKGGGAKKKAPHRPKRTRATPS